MFKFEMNGNEYQTDEQTIKVLRQAVAIYKETGSASMVAAVMALGLKAGRIVKL
jgi:hypothetical protein